MSLIVPRESFQLLRGDPKSFTGTADSGRRVECAFCPACGTRIYHAPEAMPDTFNLKPGTLEDTSWLSPGAHLWTSEKQPWLAIPEELPCFESQPR
jgi:hypothetical protein